MTKRFLILICTAALIAAAGCVKETYNMNMLSGKAHLSPVLGISAVKGDISISDLVEPNDTVVFDENNLVKFVFTLDSVIDLKLEDFYDFDEIFSFNEVYTIGEVNISPFQRSLTYTLDQISSSFSPAQRAQFLALDGTTNPFPSFPLTDLGEAIIPVIENFEYATFSEGSIDISVTNNLTAPLNNIIVRLYNTIDHTPVGDEVVIPPLDPGQTGVASITLPGLTVSNSLTAAVVLAGSPGTADPVLIDLGGSNIMAGVSGHNLLVRSGRVIVPEQILSPDEKKDTVTIDPGPDIELVRFKAKTGDLKYSAQTQSPLRTIISILLPTALRSGTPLSRGIFIHPYSVTSGTINVDNMEVDLSTDPGQQYNRIPFEHTLNVTSYGNMVSFNSEDVYNIEAELVSSVFDYIEGYFGQETHMDETDTLDPGLNDLLKKFTGDIFLSNPSIKLNYSNSFGIPVSVSIDAEGHKGPQSVPLGLAPFEIDHPVDNVTRDITSSFLINKSNSSLPQLISMPPDEIIFTGSAKLNPDGNTGSGNNFVFNNSRVTGSLEIEIPMDLRISNLQFADTVSNFLRQDNPEDDTFFNTEDFEFMRIDLTVKNGFPLGVSVSMHLYDSVSNTILRSVTAENILDAAPVDATGKVTGPMESRTSIEFTREFFSSVNDADNIIFTFTMNSTDGGTKDVSIYAGYRIDFRAVLVLKPDIKFDL